MGQSIAKATPEEQYDWTLSCRKLYVNEKKNKKMHYYLIMEELSIPNKRLRYLKMSLQCAVVALKLIIFFAKFYIDNSTFEIINARVYS